MLALPLEAECPVDKELAEERKESEDDGNAVDVSDHLLTPRFAIKDLPEDDDYGRLLAQFNHQLDKDVTYSMAKSQWGCS